MGARAFLRRDPGLVDLRPLFVSGRYYGGDKGANATSAAMGISSLRVLPFVVARTTLFSAITCEVTAGTATALLRLGVYDSDERFQPRALLVDAGTLDASTTTPATTELVISLLLQPGVYWRAACFQTAQATVRTETVGSSYVGGTTIATAAGSASLLQTAACTAGLPATFGAATASTSGPRVLLKAA